MEARKIIATNRSALKKKYRGKASQVIKLLDDIIAADKERDIDTSVIFVDDAAAMRKVKGRAVKDPANEEQNVKAVQKIFAGAKPDYLLIFGSSDIIPLIRIKNPVYKQFTDEEDADGDGDVTELDEEDGKYIDSDLPYACNVPFTRNYKAYMSGRKPIRVIGRLPDIVDKPSVRYVEKVVKHATGWKPNEEQDGNAFVLSTNDWSKISRATAKSLFGKKFDIFISKDEKGTDNVDLEKYHLHLINCHGTNASAAYWNSQNGIAIKSRQLNGHIKKGSIVAAECCFGAQLFWDKNEALAMASNYLEEGAYGFMGSTTTSYGATNQHDEPFDADIMTRYFLKYILEGRSAGSALQQARIDFKRDVFSIVRGADVLPSYKTLLQFYLLGDPSIHYIRKATAVAEAAPVPKGIKRRRAASTAKAKRVNPPRVTVKKIGKPVKEVSPKLKNLLREFGMASTPVQKFECTATKTAAPAALKTTSRKKRSAKAAKSTQKKTVQKVAMKKTKPHGKEGNPIIKILFVTEKAGQPTKVKYIESK